MAGLVTLALGTLILTQVCYVSAVPASNPSLQEDTNAVEGTITTHTLSGEHGESGKSEYMQAMNSLQKIVSHTGCKTSFNGQPISPQYCTADLLKYSSPGCICQSDQQLVLTVNQRVHEKVIGAELALYKLPEKYDAEKSLHYKVSIYYQDLQTQPLVERIIPASNSGWQVFHLDLLHDTAWLKERFNLILSIAATGPHGDTPLSCSAASELFIFNSKKVDSTRGSGASMNRPSNRTPYFPMFVTFIERSHKCGNSPCAISLKRQKRRIWFLNNYIISFYGQFKSIKRSNCSDTLLGQRVSYNLCRSNKVVFALIQPHQTASEQTTSFELCTNVSLPSTTEEILGRDLTIYKRVQPTQNITLEILLIQVVSVNPRFEMLIANSTVQTDTSGWQVFNIDRYQNVTRVDRICVDVYVRVQESVTLLSKAELMDMFVLNTNCTEGDTNCTKELDKTPLLTTFVYKTRSRNDYSFFRKKRQLQGHLSFLVGDMSAETCLFQDHIVNLSEFLHKAVMYPQVANLGQCIGDSFMKQVRGIEDEQEDSSSERLHVSQCMPTQLEDLNVLVSEGIFTSMITLPKAIAKDCGWSAN